MKHVSLRAIPSPLSWQTPPLAWQSDDDALSISAGAKTDLFIDPRNSRAIDNAPRLLFEPDGGDFLFSVRISVDFRAAFDAGVLLLYADPQRWAKLCFEYAPGGQPMVVSVVTRTVSDDCNSEPIHADAVYLRMARVDRAFAFHFSHDGRYWHLVRLFRLGETASVSVGFSAQSPTGEGCTARFTDVAFERRRLAELRNGE